MNKKPSCNLCGASLVEEDCALICSGCARPREEWLKDQAEQFAIAHQMGYAEGEAALRAENERMIQDHIRLCTALGLDADAHVDMLADAAVALRAECERLELDGQLMHDQIQEQHNHIAELKAALREAMPYLKSVGEQYTERPNKPWWIHQVLRRAAAALKGDAE